MSIKCPIPDDMDRVGITDKGVQGTNSGCASPICPEVLRSVGMRVSPRGHKGRFSALGSQELDHLRFAT